MRYDPATEAGQVNVSIWDSPLAPMRAGPSVGAGWEACLFSMETHAATSSISPPRGPCHPC
eukprot:8400144-Pyramimonas_sp.AAC.1